MNFREKYAYQLLEKRYRNIRRKVKLSGFKNATRVGIVWQWEDKEAFLYLSSFFKEKQIILRNLCYTGLYSDPVANSFGKKETNMFGFPKKGVADTFMEGGFDILMNITVNDCFPLDVVTAMSDAHFKIGRADGRLNFFDLSVDICKNRNSLYLAKQQIHYIEQFNKKLTG